MKNRERRARQVREVSAAIDLARLHEEAAQDPEVAAVFRQLREALEVALDVPRAFGGTASADVWR